MKNPSPLSLKLPKMPKKNSVNMVKTHERKFDKIRKS